MKILQRITQNFATLNAQYLLNKNRNAVRFHSQNINWNFEEVNYHVYGLIKGLNTLRFTSNDTFLLRTLPNQQSEAFITKVGVSGIGARLIVSKATTSAQLDQELKDNNVSCLIFEPNVLLQKTSFIDSLNGLVPELATHRLGSPLKLAKYPNLKKLIQTNFFSFPGVYKFRAIMNYASDKYVKVENVNVEPVTLPSSSVPLIITDPSDDFAFRAGILNSVVNGRYVHVVQPGQVNQVASQVYNNNVDIIGTNETSLHPSVRVIVQRGSGLFSQHQNRVEV